MNILQILPELNVGGVETGTRDLAKYLVKMGHKSVVVSNGGALVNELERKAEELAEALQRFAKEYHGQREKLL